MLNSIVRLSLRYRTIVLVLAALLVVAGLFAVRQARYDVFPEFLPPMVVVQTEAPGFGPSEVETLVTQPIEYSLNGLTNLQILRSNSIQGLSVVTAIFQDGTDILVARQLVSQQLAQLAGRLPQGVRSPVMAPMTSSSGIVLRIGLTAERTPMMQLRTLADWTIRPRLLGVTGVANVTVFGGEVRQYQVLVRPERLAAFDLGINEILDTVRQATGLVGAGFIENGNQRITVTAEAGTPSLETLSGVVVATRKGVPILLGQVADVVIGPEPKFGDGSIAGEPAILMTIYKQLNANTLAVTAAVERELDALRDALPSDVTIRPGLFRQANFIETALHNINVALLEGAALVIVVLFVFLMNLRTAVISLTAIPLSLLAAVVVLTACGATINTLTLGGLAIAIGEVVDDAIIDVENIYRRLRQNALLARPRSALAVVLDASIEVRSAVVFATFIVVLVFVPIFFLSGIQGKLFASLAWSYVLAILASLAVALTVTPAMSAVLLAGRRLPPEETRLLSYLKRQYARVLAATLDHPMMVGGAALCLCLAALATVPFMGGELIPELNEGNFTIHMAAVPGTSLAESLRVGASVQKELAALPTVNQVDQQVGRAELSEDIWGTNYSELQIEMKPLEGDEAEEARDGLRQVLVKYPGFYFSIKPFLTERIEELVTGTTSQVAVRIFGPDLTELDRLAPLVADVLRQVPGASDVRIEQQSGTPELRLKVKPEQCARYGLRPLELLQVLHTVFHGSSVNEVYENGAVLDVAVRVTADLTANLKSIRNILVNTPSAGRVPLETLVNIESTSGRSLIAHEGTSRRALVQCEVRGRDVDSFVREAQARIAREVPRPKNYLLEFGGEAQAAAVARQEIVALAGLALVGITLVLYAAFGSVRLVLLLLANLPFALVGGIAAVFLGGGWLSLGAVVGFVTLFGISIRNSIMLISHYGHLVTVEGHVWDRATVVQGALERLGPILMTSLVTGLGLLPIAIGGTAAGREVEQPMAIVILGGLLTSTALNLLVLPTLASRLANFELPSANDVLLPATSTK